VKDSRVIADDPAAQLRAQSEQVLNAISQLFPRLEQLVPGDQNMAKWVTVLMRLRGILLKIVEQDRFYVVAASLWPTDLTRQVALSPIAQPEWQMQFWTKCTALWTAVLSQYGLWAPTELNSQNSRDLPYLDDRFADPVWQATPLFALIHQTYLLLAAELCAASHDPASPDIKQLIDRLSPANFLLTNPVMLAEAAATKGESLIEAAQNFIDKLDHA
jgi:polyhydroxyalkanoate synthase subunit PhaC